MASKARKKVLSLRLPPSLYEALRRAAAREALSMQQFVLLAVTAKLAEEGVFERWFAERAQRGSRARYEAVLAKVPDVPPDPEDALDEEAVIRA